MVEQEPEDERRDRDEPATGNGGLALETFLPYRMMQAFERVSRDFAEVYGVRYDLTRPEWRCLATIGQFGRITATRIGAHSAMHKTKVSRAVRALEERRWLRRETDTSDRRSEHLTLTARGHQAYADLVSAAKAYEEQLAETLGEGADDLDRGLAEVERAFAQFGGRSRKSGR